MAPLMKKMLHTPGATTDLLISKRIYADKDIFPFDEVAIFYWVHELGMRAVPL